MLFLVSSLIDFMILCRDGEHEEFIVLEYFDFMPLHTAAQRRIGQAHMLIYG